MPIKPSATAPMSRAPEKVSAVSASPTTLSLTNSPLASFHLRLRRPTTAPLLDLFRSSPIKVAGKVDLGYIVTMNKKKRVATLKHRRKRKKLELKRKAQAQLQSTKS